MRSKLLNRNVIFAGVICLISCLLLWMPSLYRSPYARDEARYQGRVLETDNSLVRQYGLVKTGSQRLRVLMLDGPFAGQEVDAGNVLIGKMESDKMFRAGDQIFMVVASTGNEITAATAYDHYRLNIELLLILLFVVLLVGVTGWSGAKTCLALFFTILLVWKILLPGILRGIDPIWLAFPVVMVIAGVTLFMVGGVTKTALVAWLGALLGISLTAGLALGLFPPFPPPWRHPTLCGDPALFRLRRPESRPALHCRHLSRGFGSRHRPLHRYLRRHERSLTETTRPLHQGTDQIRALRRTPHGRHYGDHAPDGLYV